MEPMAVVLKVNLAERMEEGRRAIDAALEHFTQFDADCPDTLRDAVRYGLLAPGKRLRPLLVLWSCEACGGNPSDAIPAAVAVEMIHAYSLVHDDLPAMDDDDLRRGRPTCHKVYGDGIAILAGDALQALAFQTLANEIQPPAVAAACCAVLAHAAGPTQLVGGQADDLTGEFFSGNIDVLESVHRRKTGAMILASLRLGAIIAGANDHQRIALDDYGQKIGLAFQIVDDLLDVQGNQTDLGKRVGKDADHGKLTFPGVLGVEESQRRAKQLVDEAENALQGFGEQGSTLVALAQFILERKH
jgi:geranylgeranyl diphosphate synthase type II